MKTDHLTDAEKMEVVVGYARRRLLPRGHRPPNPVAGALGLTDTDVYNIVHGTGHSHLVHATREHVKEWLTTQLAGEPVGAKTARYEARRDEDRSNVVNLPTPARSEFVLDAALLESLIRAEVARTVRMLKGEIELHVRKETQAAVERESERAASTLLRSLTANLDAAIAGLVEKALERWTA
jgi:hypothetical protein